MVVITDSILYGIFPERHAAAPQKINIYIDAQTIEISNTIRNVSTARSDLLPTLMITPCLLNISYIFQHNIRKPVISPDVR